MWRVLAHIIAGVSALREGKSDARVFTTWLTVAPLLSDIADVSITAHSFGPTLSHTLFHVTQFGLSGLNSLHPPGKVNEKIRLALEMPFCADLQWKFAYQFFAKLSISLTLFFQSKYFGLSFHDEEAVKPSNVSQIWDVLDLRFRYEIFGKVTFILFFKTFGS